MKNPIFSGPLIISLVIHYSCIIDSVQIIGQEVSSFYSLHIGNTFSPTDVGPFHFLLSVLLGKNTALREGPVYPGTWNSAWRANVLEKSFEGLPRQGHIRGRTLHTLTHHNPFAARKGC